MAIDKPYRDILGTTIFHADMARIRPESVLYVVNESA